MTNAGKTQSNIATHLLTFEFSVSNFFWLSATILIALLTTIKLSKKAQNVSKKNENYGQAFNSGYPMGAPVCSFFL